MYKKLIFLLFLSAPAFAQDRPLLTKTDSLVYRVAYLESWIVDLETNTRLSEEWARKDTERIQKQVTHLKHYADSMATNGKRRNRKFWRSLGEFTGGFASVFLPVPISR